MIAIALFAVAGAAQTSPGSTAVVTAGRRGSASWAPYVAVGVGFGLLIIDHRDLSLVIAGVVLATLVSVRQFLAQSDLVQMQRLATYESLHDALTGLHNRRWLINDLGDAGNLFRGPRRAWRRHEPRVRRHHARIERRYLTLCVESRIVRANPA